MSIIGQAKYCLWSIGHLIQYDRIGKNDFWLICE